jgi:hypothetical protein
VALRVQQGRTEEAILFLFFILSSGLTQPSESSSPPYYQAVMDVAVYGGSEPQAQL